MNKWKHFILEIHKGVKASFLKWILVSKNSKQKQTDELAPHKLCRSCLSALLKEYKEFCFSVTFKKLV